VREEGGDGGPHSRRPPAPRLIFPLPTEAEILLQRAQRRKGPEAVPVFAEAAAAFRVAAAASPPSSERLADALFGLGEALTAQAEGVVREAARLDDAALTPRSERDAAAAALVLLDEAVAAYARLTGRVDASVNAGNALCAAATAAAATGDVAAARACVGRAVALYEGALAAAPDGDTDTRTNLADACVQGGELAAAAGDARAAGALFDAADAHYASAVATASSDEGDDLPSLLHNWGAGLRAAAAAGAGGRAALDAAAARLREAAAFGRGDVAPLLALGDALADAASLLGATPESAALLASALDEGYRAALAIDRHCADGHVGVAETCLALSRASAAAGATEAALTHAAAAVASYKKALGDPRTLGGWTERAEARYNLACAHALAGDAPAAAALLAALFAAGAAAPADAAADADLVSLRGVV